jgi:hypothetical protein
MPSLMFAQDSSKDFFAEIGNKIQNERFSLLEEKKPPELPGKYLCMEPGKKAGFKAAREMSTKEELYEELKKLREKFVPFMKNVAPEIPDYRHRLNLDTFQWRQETPEDKTDFTGILNGNGSWQQVHIPHFDAPHGRASTYYYKEITISEALLDGKALFACFKGVDYKAHVFLNGAYVGSHEGFFAPFEFNITKYAKAGTNKLLVKVDNDYTMTGFVAAGQPRVYSDKIYAVTGVGYDNFFDGGHQCAPGMGIYQDCYLESRDPIHVKDVFVRPLFDEGAVEIRLEVNNYHEERESVKYNISVFGQNFKATVLKDSLIIPSALHVPGIGDLQKPTDWEESSVKLGYGVNFFTYKVKMPDFKAWSNDTPWLYQVQVKVLDKNDAVTDTYQQTFGMRSFKMDTESDTKGRLYFNNEKIRLRGANTMGFLQQDVYKKDWEQLIDDILLAKACNMNFLRLTQRPVQPEIYDFCDQLGLMIQTDFPTFGGIRYNQWAECVRQVGEMERLIRNHPSCILSTYINERFPNGEGHPHRNMAKPEQYFSLFRAMDEAVYKENPDRVIKKSDGDYDPPTPGLPDNHCYNTWYNGQGLGIGKLYKGYWQWVKPGWYYGCGEFGAEALDPVETMNKYYPKEWLPKDKEDDKKWTANRIYAAQTQKFHYMWYNTQYSMADWVEASHDHQVWALDMVTEAFRRDTNMVTFAMHLFIDAWPAGWMKTIMDVDRNPKKAFFTYRNALKPTIVSLRSDRRHFYAGEKIDVESWICHDPNTVPQGYVLKYQLEHKGRIIRSGRSEASVPANSAQFQGYIKAVAPKVKKRTSYQLRAALFDAKGQSVDQTVFEIDVFPAKQAASTSTLAFLNEDESSINEYLSKNLNVKAVEDWKEADVVWVSDYQLYEQHQEELDAMARNGKRVVLYNVPVGDHQIGGTEVKIQNTSMGSYYFASPQTGHRFTADVKPFDFKMWYDEKAGYIKPFLNKIVVADDWESILSTGNTNWVEDHGKASAIGELKLGTGNIIICQLDFENKILSNPTASLLIKNILLQE